MLLRHILSASLLLGLFTNSVLGQVSVLGVEVGSEIVIAGDSFSADTGVVYPNTNGDWPAGLEAAGYDIHHHAAPGYRLGFHILEGGLNGTSFPTWESHLASATDPELIIIAAGLNDLLVRYGSFDVGGPYEDPSLQQYFDPGNSGDSFSRFRSTLLWNVGRVLIERAVAEAKAAHPDVPILLFNIAPFELFSTSNFLRQNGESLNDWYRNEAPQQLGVAVFDLDAFMRDPNTNGGYPANTAISVVTGQKDNLHPDELSQALLTSQLLLTGIGASPYLISPVTEIILGDVNQDDVVSFLDLPPFVEVLINGEFQAEADVDQNEAVGFSDIPALIEVLISR